MPAQRRDMVWILAPMLATFAGLRSYLHFVDFNADFFVAGHNVHHLHSGAVMVIAAAFALAIGARRGIGRRLAQAALGAGSAMVLDEIVYLIVTDGSNDSYVTAPSLWGAAVFIVAGAAWAIALGWRGPRENR